jgi:hypothetical protein
MFTRFTRVTGAKALSLALAFIMAAGCGPTKKSPPPQDIENPDSNNDALNGAQAPSSLISQANLPQDDSELANLNDIISRMDLKAYHERGYRGQNLTIAVLDNGFMGLQQSLGRRLPPWLKVEASPRDEMQKTNHGTKMAEIAYAVASGSRFYRLDTNGPRILLFNANGYTNLQAAVKGAIKAKADIVLYSQVWEYGGNWDGKGFINKLVSKATAAGILWVNAAGNLGLSTYAAPIRMSSAQDVMLPDAGNSVRFTVPQDGVPVKIVLAWNDFRDTKEHRTEQDLDLILSDDQGREKMTSKLVQSGSRDTEAENYSAHAREIIQTQLKRGVYRLRVAAKTQNFNANSRLRLTVDGNGVRMFSATTSDSLPVPADNPDVLAIGANDVNYSGKNAEVEVGKRKPELALKSYVSFNDGIGHHGTSAATAIAVGSLAAYQSAWGKLDRAGVITLLQRGRFSSPNFTLPSPPERR